MEKFRHILVVDDDHSVRDMLRAVLAELGYRVSLAENGAVARPILDLRDVDLLVADELLRGEKGRALADYARSLGVPTLLMSAHNEIKQDFAGLEQHFIGKPFRLQQFHDEVRRVLSQPKAGADGH